MTQEYKGDIASLFKRTFSQLIKLCMNMKVVAFILAVIVFQSLGVVNLWPFTTRGTIYVDSPEVYTRERLVNDRYDQDYWLHQQLVNLDKPQNSVTEEIAERSSVGIGNGANPPATNPSNSSNRMENPPLPFAQEFAIKAGIREAIRQLVLENMLDDRHDLTGNSVYGLKFDTTVIPGANTIGRAFVRINISVEDPFQIELDQYMDWPDVNLKKLIYPDKSQKPPKVPNHVIAYYAQSYIGESNGIMPNSPLYEANKQYTDWLNNISDRLNTHMHRKIKSSDFEKKCESAQKKETVNKFMQDAISDNLSLVLGVANDVKIKGKKIDLAEPWSKFMEISYEMEEENSCNTQPIFTVISKVDEINVFKKVDWPLMKDTTTPDYNYTNPSSKVTQPKGIEKKTCDDIIFIKIDETKNHVLALSAKKPNNCVIDQIHEIFVRNFKSLAYSPSDEFIEFADDVNNLKPKCGNEMNQASCRNNEGSKDRKLYIPSGLFNFIDKVVERDLYTYAVFPKNEVAGILSNSSVDLAVSADAYGSSWLNFGKDLRESRLESMSVGFGDGSKGNLNDQEEADNDSSSKKDKGNMQENIKFGWVLSALGKMEPTQKTELALISVPAWTKKLNLKITTGWLDRNANENAEQSFDMQVPVPPEYQAFDALIIEGQHQRRPKILNNLMDANLEVFACENAKILIPGSRLWRSAVVTLGAQRADKITVLPNMEGIIAEFTTVDIPHSGNENVQEVKLQVWTSEGVDSAEVPIKIQLPGKGHACPSTVAKKPEDRATVKIYSTKAPEVLYGTIVP